MWGGVRWARVWKTLSTGQRTLYRGGGWGGWGDVSGLGSRKMLQASSSGVARWEGVGARGWEETVGSPPPFLVHAQPLALLSKCSCPKAPQVREGDSWPWQVPPEAPT